MADLLQVVGERVGEGCTIGNAVVLAVSLTLAAGAGRHGPLGEATAYLFDARRLVEHAVG
jgi:hypothetical protein